MKFLLNHLKLSLREKFNPLLRESFNIEAHLHLATEWEDSETRSELVCLPEERVCFSTSLNSYVLLFFDSQRNRLLLKLSNLDADKVELQKIEAALHSTFLSYFHEAEQSLLQQTSGDTGLYGKKGRRLKKPDLHDTHSDEIGTEVESTHIALLGAYFSNFKFALNLHEKSNRWAFLKIENSADLEVLRGYNDQMKGSTFFISDHEDETIFDNPILLEVLNRSPEELGVWIILSSSHKTRLENLPRGHVYVHVRLLSQDEKIVSLFDHFSKKKTTFH